MRAFTGSARPPRSCPRARAGSPPPRRRASPTPACPSPGCPSCDGDPNGGCRSARPRVLRGRAVSARNRIRRAPGSVATPSGASGAARLRGRGVLGGGGAGGAREGAAAGLAPAVGWGWRHSRAAPAAARLPDDALAPGELIGLRPGHARQALDAPSPWLTLLLAGRYVSSQFLRGDEANTQPKRPAYLVLDASVAGLQYRY